MNCKLLDFLCHHVFTNLCPRYELYFEKVYPMMPMIHKLRYYASLDLPPHMRPPPSLQYAIWANAASVSDKYLYYQDVLYERARKYSREAEMKVSQEGPFWHMLTFSRTMVRGWCLFITPKPGDYLQPTRQRKCSWPEHGRAQVGWHV
jgi:hypothetical protein